MRYWSESQFSSDFLLFLIINMQSSLHASLWKHRNLTRLRYSIIHFLMQNGVNAWINYVSTRDCWFYVPVGRCWSSGTPINTPLTVRAQLSYNRLCTPIKMYRHNYRRLSAGASFPRLLLWFTGGCVLKPVREVTRIDSFAAISMFSWVSDGCIGWLNDGKADTFTIITIKMRDNCACRLWMEQWFFNEI